MNVCAGPSRILTLVRNLILAALALSGSAHAQTTYTWNVPGGGSWGTAANWSPPRTVQAPTDVIVFDGAVANGTITGPGGPVGRVVLQNAASIVLSGGGLPLNGGAGTDLVIPAGSTLHLSGLELVVGPGATALISGTVVLSGTAPRLRALDAGAIVVASGGRVEMLGLGNAFGTTNASSVVFQFGSTYLSANGSDPFGMTAPSSVVVFEAGSVYRHEQNALASLAGRTYGDFVLNAAGYPGTTASSGPPLPFTVDNLTIGPGSMRIWVSDVNIRGNVLMQGAAGLTFDPATSQTVTFGGTSAQTISRSGPPGAITFGPATSVVVSNPAGVSLSTTMSLAGTSTVQAGSRLSVLGGGSLTTTGPLTVQGVFERGPGAGAVSGTDFTYSPTGKLVLSDSSPLSIASANYWPDGAAAPPSVEIQGGGGVTFLGGMTRTVSGVLTLGNGVLDASSGELVLEASAIVAGGSAASHVKGSVRRLVPASGSTGTFAFPIGDGTVYAPLSLEFSSVSVGGSLTASTTPGDHASIASSGLNPAASVNRTWSVTNAGVVFPQATVSLTFGASDVDGGANPLAFSVRKFDAPATWTALPSFSQSPTGLSAVGITSFSDFQVGESEPPASSHVFQISGDITCDNEFAVFTANSELSGMQLNYQGVRGCHPQAIPVSISTSDRYLYVAAWSDDAAAQGLLHDLTVDGQPAFSGSPAWQVTYTDTDHDPCLGSIPPAMVATIGSVVSNPPGGWQIPAVGCANPASGEPNCYGVWGSFGSISTSSRRIWYDSGNQGGVNAPFEPGFNHREFLIFRLDMAGLLASADTCTGSGWIRLSAAGPPARSEASLVEDPDRATLMLFGGIAGVLPLGDTWEWDGNGWSWLDQAVSPPARSGHAVAWDPQRDRAVLFGGKGAVGRLGDTWEWADTAWTLVSTTGPSPRSGHSMAFDESLGVVVLFGGSTDAGRSGETWTWNGTSWSLVATTGPPARSDAAMATDPTRRKIVLFGGSPADPPAAPLGDTWEWGGTGWVAVAPDSNPPARAGAAMTFAGEAKRIVMTGGSDAFGPIASATTWSWDGQGWSELPHSAGTMVGGRAAFDMPNGRVALFGGRPSGDPHANALYELCCDCDDESARLDSLGQVVFPGDVDMSEPITYEDVDIDMGDIETQFPNFQTSSEDWLERFPCARAIGGQLPEGANNPALDDSLLALGIGAAAQDIADSLDAWGNALLALFENEPDPLMTAPPVGPPASYVAPTRPYCPPDTGTFVFGGRDIIFVHGLKVNHVADRLLGGLGDIRSQIDWVPPTSFPGSTENPEFYLPGGYYRDDAVSTWSEHIQEFLTSRGIKNRYLIVSYPCNARLDVGIQAILTQISDAMRFGTNVVNPLGPDKSKFGTPSFVIISHSTGALATDAALWSATNYPNLGATFIPGRCKAHLSIAGALGGSRLATAAVTLSGLLGASIPSWLCELVSQGIQWFNVTPPPCPFASGVVGNSVLVDLIPLVTRHRWGTAIENTGVPAVTMSGAHPTFMGPLKRLLAPGFDDGVVTINSTSPNPGTPLLWPNGFVVQYGPVGMVRTFDMGMAGSYPFRALNYYWDQTYDPLLTSATGLIPFYVASGPVPDLSPTGMLQSVGIRFPGTDLDPLKRPAGHYSFMSSAGDHFTLRSGEGYPDYHKTYEIEPNFEETRALRGQDEVHFRAHNTPGPVFYAGDDQPLMAEACVPRVNHRVMGRYVQFKLFRSGKGKKLWIWKRHYFQPPGTRDRHLADYMYSHILACEPPNWSCDSTVSVGDASLGHVAFGAPNPFHDRLDITFSVPSASNVEVDILDLAGRRIRRLAAGRLEPGMHHAAWDGALDVGGRARAGVYFWRLRMGERVSTRKVVLLR